MFHKQLSLLLCVALFSCHLLVSLVEAGHHGRGGDNGLGILLAAGLLAKILRHHKHEEHHIHIPVPVHDHHEHHGHHEHGHHGSGTTRYVVHHPAPFNHLYGGMLGAPSFAHRMYYAPPQLPRYPEPMY